MLLLVEVYALTELWLVPSITGVSLLISKENLRLVLLRVNVLYTLMLVLTTSIVPWLSQIGTEA